MGQLTGRVFWSQEHPQSAEAFLRAVLAWRQGPVGPGLALRCAQALLPGDVIVLDELRSADGEPHEEDLALLRQLVAAPEFEGKRLIVVSSAELDLGPRSTSMRLGPLGTYHAQLMGARMRQASRMFQSVRIEDLKKLATLLPGEVAAHMEAIRTGSPLPHSAAGLAAAAPAHVQPAAAQEPAAATPVDPAADAKLQRLSNVGLLAHAFNRIFDTPFDVHEWVKLQVEFSHLAKSLPFHSTSGASTRLASLLVGRGYLDHGLIDLVEGEEKGKGPDLDVLRKRVNEG